MLAAVGEEILAREEKILVTKGADGSIYVIAYNPCYPDEEPAGEEIELEIAMEDGEVTVEDEWIDERVGNARAAWAEIGEPAAPKAEQLDWLEKEAAPEYAIRREKVTGGKLMVKFNLPSNGVRLLTIR